MVFDLAAWTVILVVAYSTGRGALALLRADVPRSGDHFILAAWVGVVICAVALLAVSLFSPLTPAVSALTAGALAALGRLALWRRGVPDRARGGSRMGRWTHVAGVSSLVLGAAALASDPVTLYDSLVYHVGLIRWLREGGTVPGMALIHNRLGHVSAWFTLGAVFDAGPGANRAANVPLGFALWLVGLQGAIVIGRIARGRSSVSDWFLAVASLALIWAVATRGAATPSPDVATNVLIIMCAWSLIVVMTPDPGVAPRGNEQSAIGAHLVPLVLALGACAMKLFAAPAVIATGAYAIVAAGRAADRMIYVRRLGACVGLGLVIVGPFVAANLLASGCPAYPSPIGCLDTAWSVGASRATDYAGYVRDVARWERRGETSVGASLGWLGPWVLAHPIIALLAVLTPALAVFVKHRSDARRTAGHAALHRDGVVAILAVAILGTFFTAWQAPAPRFMYAFVLIVPALALSVVLQTRASRRDAPMPPVSTRRGGVAFLAISIVIGVTYGLASQKLNVMSALARGAALAPVSVADLLLPAAPEAPARLFRWRVNDVDVLTPVPRPIADTLGYQSVIAFNASFEKCSTAPLPCTPYLPTSDIRLRRPSLGLRGGFMRTERPDFAGRAASCVGELGLAMPAAPSSPASSGDGSHCGDERR